MAKQPKVNVNSWMTNFVKSTGRFAIEQGIEYAPGIFGAVNNTVEAANSFSEIFPKESFDKFKDQAKTNAGYIKKFFDNMKRDLKTGDFYDISKIDTSGGGEDDFSIDGDWDIDFGDNEEFSEEDFNIDINPTINITSNINGNNPMVKAIQNQTVAGAKQAKASAKQTIEVAEAQMTLMSKLNESVVSQLSGIKSTLDALLEFHNANTKTYYEKTLELQAMQMEHFKELSEAKGYKKRELNTDAVDLLNAPFDIKSYTNIVKGNFKRFSNDSMVLTALNEFWSSPEAKEAIVANPLSFVIKGLVNAVIPATFVSALKETDTMFSRFIPSLFAKMNKLRDNPIFEPLAKIFGLETKYKKNIDLGNYNKGAVAFDGKVHKAITEVIPTQLAQILAVLKRNPYDPQLFDYDTGTFTSSKKALETHKANLKNYALGEYDIDEIRKRLSTVSYRDSNEKKEVDKALEAVLMKMTSTGTTIDFRKRKDKKGNEVDELSKVIKEAGIYLSPAKLNLIRHSILKSPKLSQMGLTASIFNSRHAVSQYTQGIENGDVGGIIRQALAIADAENIDKAYKELIKNKGKSKNKVLNLDAKGEEARRKKLAETYRLEYSDDLTEKEIMEAITNRADYVSGKMDERKRKLEEKNKDKSGRSIFTELKGMFRDTVRLPFTISTKILDGMSNKMYEIIFGKDYNEQEADKGFLEKWNDYLVQGLDKIKEYFKEHFGEPAKRVYNKAKDYITNTQTYKDVKGFLFGEKDGEGNITSKGLFSNTLGEFKNLGAGVRRLFTGKGYKDNVTGEEVKDLSEKESVFGVFKNTFFEIGGFIKTTLIGGWNFTKNTYGKLKGPDGQPFSLVDSIKSGFNDFLTLFFGNREMHGKKNANFMTLDTFKEAMKKNAPKSLALGMGFGLANLTGISSTFGILGSIFMPGGPIGSAIVGTGIGFLTQAEFFKEFMFGKMVNGQRTDTGIISKATQDAFDKHKGAIIGGAAVGGIMALLRKNIFSSLASSFLGPAFLAKYGIAFSLMGGPIGGAAIGAGLAYLKSSESAREWLFGKGEWLKTSGSKIAERFVTAFNSGGFKAVGRGIVGAGLGALSMGGLALAGFNPIGAVAGLTAKALAFGGISVNMGFLGSLSTKLLAGAIAGGAFGITASFSKWQSYMFGEIITREGVKYKIPGFFGKMGNMLKWEVFEPMKTHFLNGLDAFRLWFRKDVMSGVQDIFVPLMHEVSHYAKKFVAGIGKVFKWLNPKNFIVEAFIAPIGKHLVAPLVGFFKSSSASLFKTIGTVIAQPFKVMGYMANKLIMKQFGRGLSNFRKKMLDNMKNAYLNSGFHKELVRPVIKIFTFFGNEILFQVKGFFSKASKILLAAIKLPFKIIGFTAKMGLKAAALPFTLPFKAINAFRKNRISAISGFKATDSQRAIYDSYKNNDGFLSSMMGLLSTFVPGGAIRRLAQTDKDFDGADYVAKWQEDKAVRDKANDELGIETNKRISDRNKALSDSQRYMRNAGYGPEELIQDDEEDVTPEITPNFDLVKNITDSENINSLMDATNLSSQELKNRFGKEGAKKLNLIRNSQFDDLKRKYGSTFSTMTNVDRDNLVRDVLNSQNTNIIAENSIRQTSLLSSIAKLLTSGFSNSSSGGGENSEGRDVGDNNERSGDDVEYKESDSVHDEDYESQQERVKEEKQQQEAQEGQGWLAKLVDKMYDFRDDIETAKNNSDGGGLFGLLGKLRESLSGIGVIAAALLLPGPRNLIFQGISWLGENIFPIISESVNDFMSKHGEGIKDFVVDALKRAGAWLLGLDYNPLTEEEKRAREEAGNGFDITNIPGEIIKRMTPGVPGSVAHTNFVTRILRQPKMLAPVIKDIGALGKGAVFLGKTGVKGIKLAHKGLQSHSALYKAGTTVVKGFGKVGKWVGGKALLPFNKLGSKVVNKVATKYANSALKKTVTKNLTDMEYKLFSELVESGQDELAEKMLKNTDEGVSLLARATDDFIAAGKNIFLKMWTKIKNAFSKSIGGKLMKKVDDFLLKIFKKEAILNILKKTAGISKKVANLYQKISANASVAIPVIGIIINAVMIAYGAIKGNNMAAWLFQVQPEDIGPMQRLISIAVFAALEGTAIGGLIDLVDTIFRACKDMIIDGARMVGLMIPHDDGRGTGFIQWVVQFIYSLILKFGDSISEVFGVDAENEKLFRENQQKMVDRYNKNVNKDSGISFDEYMVNYVHNDPESIVNKVNDYYNSSSISKAWKNLTSFGKAGLPAGLDPKVFNAEQIAEVERKLSEIEDLPSIYKNNNYNFMRDNLSKVNKDEANEFKKMAQEELKKLKEKLKKADDHAEEMLKQDTAAGDYFFSAYNEAKAQADVIRREVNRVESDIRKADRNIEIYEYYKRFNSDKMLQNAPNYGPGGSYNKKAEPYKNKTIPYGPNAGGTSDTTYMDKLANMSQNLNRKFGLMSPEEMLTKPLTAGSNYSTADGRSSKALEFMKANYVMTSPFGENRGNSIHEGIDLVSSVGDPVPAFMPGIVHKVYNNAKPNTGNMNSSDGGGFGNHVIIKDMNGMYHTYAHLNEVASGLTPGSRVNMFDVIGKLGHTGRSSGAHLHYQIADDTRPGIRKPVNPFDYIMTGAKNGGIMSRNALKDLKVDAIAHAVSQGSFGDASSDNPFGAMGLFDELMNSIGLDMAALLGMPTGPGGTEGTNATYSTSSELPKLNFNYSGKGVYDAQSVVDYDKDPSPTNLNGGAFLDVFSKAPLEKRADGDSTYYRESEWFDRNLKTGVGNVTEEYMNRWIDHATRFRQNSPFRGQGAAFIKAAQQTGLDPRYLMAHAALESGWGSSSHTSNGNYFGIGVYDGKKGNTFNNSSFESSIIEGSKWIADNYINRGQNTIWKMHTGHEHHNFNRGNWWANNLTKILDNAPKGGSSDEMTIAQLMASLGKGSGGGGSTQNTPSGIKLPKIIDNRLVEIIEILKMISGNTNDTTEAIKQLLAVVATDAKVRVTSKKSTVPQSKSVSDNDRLRQYENALDIALVR